nr:uncharacterized protein LOC128684745 [Cherax quadricarinatus]
MQEHRVLDFYHPLGAENHSELIQQLKDTFRFGHRHLDIPISGEVSDIVLKQLRRFCSSNCYSFNRFFITTSIPVPVRLDDALKLIHDFYERLDKTPVDVLYLENPVGLEGSDPLTIFQSLRYGTYWNVLDEGDIFRRDEDTGTLCVIPDILQNLWAIWDYLARYVLGCRLAHNLGLKNFSQPQIEKLLEEATVHPRVLQVEVNLYSMKEELRSMCQENNIAVCAIHPFGNPFYVPRTGKPALIHNPLVNRMADVMDIDAKIVLLCHLYQAQIPFVLDNDMMIGIGWMFQQIQNIKLTECRMKRLCRINNLNPRPIGRRKLLASVTDEPEIQKDSLWPFCFFKTKTNSPPPPSAEDEKKRIDSILRRLSEYSTFSRDKEEKNMTDAQPEGCDSIHNTLMLLSKFQFPEHLDTPVIRIRNYRREKKATDSKPRKRKKIKKCYRHRWSS